MGYLGAMTRQLVDVFAPIGQFLGLFMIAAETDEAFRIAKLSQAKSILDTGH
jgi:hypothetical protein